MAKKKVKEINEVVVEAPVETVKPVEAPKPNVLKFSKKQFVDSKRFANRKDLVNALLKEGEMYSIVEVEDLIKNFLYGKK